ncbi:MAG: glycosyltransferase [Planctomycetota bacterium]
MAGLHVVIVPAWWPSPEEPIGGVFFVDYALAYAEAGAKVGVVVPDLVSVRHLGRGTSIPWLPRAIEEDIGGVPVVRVRGLHTAFGRPGVQMRRFRRWLRRGLAVYRDRHGSPDVLHAMCAIPSGWACTHLADQLSDRVVVTEHTGPFSLVLSPKAGESYVQSALARAARVVAVSETLRAQMLAAGINREITVFGNPVAPTFATRAPASPGIRQASPLRVLFVGRMAPEKGVGELAEAAVSLGHSYEAQWHFVGDGPLTSTVHARLASGGLADRLHLHGNCERAQVAELMSQSDFLVLPSYGETFGMAAVEALCMGLPVVATRGTAPAAFVSEDDGLLVDAGDVESLAAGLQTMRARLDTYDSAAIARRARQRFSGESMAAQYAGLFRAVIGRGG